jgi:hypothetical protein
MLNQKKQGSEPMTTTTINTRPTKMLLCEYGARAVADWSEHARNEVAMIASALRCLGFHIMRLSAASRTRTGGPEMDVRRLLDSLIDEPCIEDRCLIGTDPLCAFLRAKS